MKKLLLLSTFLFLLATITYGQASATSRTVNSPLKHQLGKTTGSLQRSVTHSISKTAENKIPDANPILPNAPNAWTSTWNFSQSPGTYTAITGGTTLGTATNDENVFSALSIGFTFNYNGTAYTQFGVMTNGFIVLGSGTPGVSSLPLSGGSSNNVLCALGLDLIGQTGASLQYKLEGSGSNRTLVVQWANYKKKAGTGDAFNFQIRLNEINNSVAFVYGAFTVNSTTSTPQVGIRGASSAFADISNRLGNAGTYTSWTWSGPGTANTSTCRLQATIFPASGETYGWTPYSALTSTLPLSENFDGVPTGTLPVGWSVANSNSDAWSWYNGAVLGNSTPNSMFIRYNSSVAMNDWFFSPKVSLTIGHTYKVTCYYMNDGGTTYPEKLEVKYGLTNTAAGMTSAALISNTAITGSYQLGSGSFVCPATNNYYFGWHGFSAMDEDLLLVDDITISEVVTDDVGPIALFNPTKLPISQQLPWFGKVQNFGINTETFDVDTKLRENSVAVPALTQTNTITSLATNATASRSGFMNLSTLGSGSSFDLALQTKLTGDLVPSNDILTQYTRPCTRDTVYAWDDGTDDGAIGYDTGNGWLGQMYYITQQDTITSITVKWGDIPGAIAGNSFEVFSVAGGLPTAKFADIVTGISLTLADSGQWRTYKASSPVILPVGTYWIGAHQSVALAGTFLLSDDGTGINATNYLSGFAFYSSTGAAGSWTDYATGGLAMINMVRPNFANILVPFVPNPTAVTATPVSSTEIDLSWALSSGYPVLLAWNTTGVFGTPSGSSYSVGSTISGPGTGTVLLAYSSLTSYIHNPPLTPNTKYYYKIWSYKSAVTSYSAGVAVDAQTFCTSTPTPWSEGFEGTTFPPTCWESYEGSTIAWERATTGGLTGSTASAYADFFDAPSGDIVTLVTLPYSYGGLGELINPRLSFDWAYQTYAAGYMDEMDILYSTDNGANWYYLYIMYGGTTGEMNTAGASTTAFVPSTSGQWKTKILSLPAGTNKIAFMGISDNGNNLYLDNIQTVEALAHDAGVESIDSPTINTVVGSTVIPKATVVNYGMNTESFNVTMTITGGYSSTVPIPAPLAPGASVQVSFASWIPTAVGQVTVKAYTSLSGDLDATNDTLAGVGGVYTGAWTNGTNYPTTTYLGTGVGYVDPAGPTGYLFSMGGNTESGSGTECYKYNCTTDTWSSISSLPSGRRVLASACVGNYIYAIGGSDMSGAYQNTVYKYDIVGAGPWVPVATLPVAIGWGKAVAHGNYIYFAGGYDGTNVLATVYVYNVSTDIWLPATAMPVAKYGGAFSVSGDILAYIAGADAAGITNTVYSGTISGSDPTAISWGAKSNYPGPNQAIPRIMDIDLASQVMPEGRAQRLQEGSKAAAYPAGAMYRFDGAPWGTDGIIVTGGSPTSDWLPAYPNPTYLYKPNVDTWTQEPYLPKPVTGASLGSVNLSSGLTHIWKLIVAGGIDITGNDTSYTQILTDDVTEPLPHDVGVSSINANEVINLGVTPTATVKNYGTSIETFDVKLTIGSFESTKTVSSLSPTLSETVVFDAPAWSSTVGDYSIQVCIDPAIDPNSANDCLTQNVKVLDLNKKVFGYIAFQDPQTDSIGPATFSLATPGDITNLNPQGAQNFVSGGTWANGKWYGAVYDTITPYDLVTIDTTTGLRSVIGDMGRVMNGLSYNVADGNLYGVGYTSPNSRLYTISMTTGDTTFISIIPNMLLINLAIDNLGNCYSLDLFTDQIIKITLPGGTYDIVGWTGFSAYYAQDMEFDRMTGNLFIAADDGDLGWLGWVNTTTGAVLKIANFDGGAEITGFAIPYSSSKTLNLTDVFMEGLYAGSHTMNQALDIDLETGNPVAKWADGVADTITVELHDSTAYAYHGYETIIYKAISIPLLTDGTASVTIPSEYNSAYYVTIKHRNHLETTSAFPVVFTDLSSVPYAFDAQDKAYGNNMGLMLDGVAVIFGGDENQDSAIEGYDLAEIGNAVDAFGFGYIKEDIDGNAGMDGYDLAPTGNNSDAFVAVILP
jgi:hypothetical protein